MGMIHASPKGYAGQGGSYVLGGAKRGGEGKLKGKREELKGRKRISNAQQVFALRATPNTARNVQGKREERRERPTFNVQRPMMNEDYPSVRLRLPPPLNRAGALANRMGRVDGY